MMRTTDYNAEHRHFVVVKRLSKIDFLAKKDVGRLILGDILEIIDTWGQYLGW